MIERNTTRTLPTLPTLVKRVEKDFSVIVDGVDECARIEDFIRPCEYVVMYPAAFRWGGTHVFVVTHVSVGVENEAIW